MIYDLCASYPPAEVGGKGLAVRQLKRYASWVQSVVRQLIALTFGDDNELSSSIDVLIFENLEVFLSKNKQSLKKLRFY